MRLCFMACSLLPRGSQEKNQEIPFLPPVRPAYAGIAYAEWLIDGSTDDRSVKNALRGEILGGKTEPPNPV
jgi:hypothetical protein